MMRALFCAVVRKLRFGAWVRSHIIMADAVALLLANATASAHYHSKQVDKLTG